MATAGVRSAVMAAAVPAVGVVAHVFRGEVPHDLRHAVDEGFEDLDVTRDLLAAALHAGELLDVVCDEFVAAALLIFVEELAAAHGWVLDQR